MRVMSLQNEAVSDDVNRVWQDTATMCSRLLCELDYSKFRDDVNPQEIIRMLL